MQSCSPGSVVCAEPAQAARSARSDQAKRCGGSAVRGARLAATAGGHANRRRRYCQLRVPRSRLQLVHRSTPPRCSGTIVVADPPRADQPLTNRQQLHGKLALMQRGGADDQDYVPVAERVRRLQEAGVVAVVLANPGENEGVFGG